MHNLCILDAQGEYGVMVNMKDTYSKNQCNNKTQMYLLHHINT